jgi:hypothetical protein
MSHSASSGASAGLVGVFVVGLVAMAIPGTARWVTRDDSSLIEQAARAWSSCGRPASQIPEIDADRQGAAAGQVHSRQRLRKRPWRGAAAFGGRPHAGAGRRAAVAPAMTSRAIDLDLEALRPRAS